MASQGATHATPDHVRAIALPVMRHRIVTNFNAEADGVKAAFVKALHAARARAEELGRG